MIDKQRHSPYLKFAFFAFLLVFGQGLFAHLGQAKVQTSVPEKFNLIMIEEHGCPYCRAWVLDVGNYYHKTTEGKFAPLSRVDTTEAKSQFNLNINFTPTFVVLKNGKEVGRLIGYIDDSFFWPKLDNILAKMGYKDPS